MLRVAENATTNVISKDWIDALGGLEALPQLLTVNAISVEGKLGSLCAKFPEVFAEGLGHCTKIRAHVELRKNATPVFRKPFPLALAMHEAIEKELNRYVDVGVLSPVDRSTWAAPIVMAKKPNNKTRICADFSTGLNERRLVVDSHPIPRPEDLYQALQGGEKFTKLDLSNAYLQVELDEESKGLLVINTHKGLYRYNRLPFGIASAPAIFQKIMDTMLSGIPHVAAYLDDIILTGTSNEEHLVTLSKVLSRLKEYGFHIRKEKCAFLQKEVEYLGHILSAEGIKADPQKTAAVINMPLPNNFSQLFSFLGMCNCYGEFVSRLADMCSSLNQLLRQGVPWRWGQSQADAVEKIKRILSSLLLFTQNQAEWPIVLAADASNEGVGPVLYHRLQGGTVEVIVHASKTLTAAKRNTGNSRNKL